MFPLAPLERELVRTGPAGTVLVLLALEIAAVLEASCSSGATSGGAVGAANAMTDCLGVGSRTNEDNRAGRYGSNTTDGGCTHGSVNGTLGGAGSTLSVKWSLRQADTLSVEACPSYSESLQLGPCVRC